MKKLLYPRKGILYLLPQVIFAMLIFIFATTAMITRFSANGEDYRKLMNTLTGMFVYGAVVFIAIYMIIKASIYRERAVTGE